MLAAAILALLSPVTFTDQTQALGLPLGGAAACWIDVNRDGWPDLVTSDAVWRNDKGSRFERLADAGAAVAADYDNDGYPDIFCWSSLRLLHNMKGAGFEPAPLPELPPSVSRGACWGDFNGDGFVDLYIGGYEDWDKGITYPSFLLLNEKGKQFRIAWTSADRRTRGVTACDYDQDGDLDIYASNYRLQPNNLWQNDKIGGLTDVAAEANALATSSGFAGGHSIGACWGDFDNDGFFDLFAGNFAHVDSRGDQPKSRFLRNTGTKGAFRFEDKGTCGVFYQESYASPAAGDFDNDGMLDLLFTTVYGTASFGKPNYSVLFGNQGNFELADTTEASGLAKLPPTYQAAWADFDRDGDLDLACAGRLYGNNTSQTNWIEVRLEGDGKKVNRSAIGTQVRIRLGKQTLSRQVEAGTGEGNQNDLVLHFGLGAQSSPVDLEITWPGGKKQTVRRQKPNRIVEVRLVR